MSFDPPDWNFNDAADYDEEGGFDDSGIEFGCGPADDAADLFIWRADRLAQEGYSPGDVIHGLILTLQEASASMIKGKLKEQTAGDFALLVEQLKSNEACSDGDLIHAICQSLAEFTSQLRSDVK